MNRETFGATLFRARHLLGAIAAAAVAWIPLTNGFRAYEPISNHGECGFLCLFLFVALFWWIVAVVGAAFVWFAVVMLLRLARGKDRGV
jgi:hypothetical protein